MISSLYIYYFLHRRCWYLFEKRIMRKNIRMDGLNRISPTCDIEVDKSAQIYLGKGVRIEKNCLIAARPNAKVTLGKNIYINRNTIIVAHNNVQIDDGVTIGPNCCIFDHDHNIKRRGSFISKKIWIQENVWLGANVIIMKGVTIGKNSVVAAGSVVTKDIPPDSILVQKRTDSICDI